MTAVHAATSLVDPDLPGLGVLLDDEALGQLLAARGEQLLRRDRVHYRPGTSCVVALELASGRAFAVATPAAPGSGSGVRVAPMCADADLPALGDLTRTLRLAPGLHRDVAAELVPDPVHDPLDTVRTVTHEPGHRWVGIATAARVVLQGHRREDWAGASRRLASASGVHAVTVPRLLARSRRLAALAVEHLPGVPLGIQRAFDPDPTPYLAAAGHALAMVHSGPLPGLPVSIDPGTGTAEVVRLVGALLPGLRDRVADLHDALLARRPPAGPPVSCHGDLSLDRVVRTRDGALAFVGWERSGAGVAAADLGSLIAAGAAPHACATFLDGYREVAPLPRDLPWHVAAAGLRRLADPFSSASPHWVSEIEDRLARLEQPWTEPG